MAKPPAGVDDVFAATMVLLAGTSPSVVTTKAGKVKDRSWDASKKQLLGELRSTTACRVGARQYLVSLPSSACFFLLIVPSALARVVNIISHGCRN